MVVLGLETVIHELISEPQAHHALVQSVGGVNSEVDKYLIA